jgi:hypothetical protein
MPLAPKQLRYSFYKSLALAILALIAIGQANSLAFANDTRDRDRNATTSGGASDWRRWSSGYCLPANGAQILGGFAAPNEWLDSATDEICRP